MGISISNNYNHITLRVENESVDILKTLRDFLGKETFDSHGNTLLNVAIGSDNTEIVKELLDLNIDPLYPMKNDSSLHCASYKGNIVIIKLLLYAILYV